MASTVIVLVVSLIGILAVGLVSMFATFHLAKRHGQRVKSVSLSLAHGFTAEFFPPEEEPQSGSQLN
jgi:hypothetical protein